MCGIFGYAGRRQDAGSVVIQGLKRLDYRGYDSWGVAVSAGGALQLEKHAGKIDRAVVKLPASQIAIGHTRWATHGAVTEANAHPHAATDGSFALAQNGIFANYLDYKRDLATKGYPFLSETDTEVIVRLIEEEQTQRQDLAESVRQAFLQLEGRNTIILLTKDGDLIACRNGSPLVMGFNQDKTEIYFSSDVLSFAEFVSQVLILDNQQMVVVHDGQLKLTDIKTGQELTPHFEANSISDNRVDKQGFDHFMIKEIHENPMVIARVADRGPAEYEELATAIKKASHVYTIGSGTAGNAAAQLAYYLRAHAAIPAVSLIGAEAQEYFELFGPNDVLIAPSQSGETADVLEVLEIARQKGSQIASYVNMPGSIMTRVSDYKYMAQAGPEISVVSTKIFTSQIAWAYLVAKTVAGQFDEGKQQLDQLREAMASYLADPETHQTIKTLAHQIRDKQHFFLLAKGQNLQIIKEAMIKIIEESYMHAHAISAGDLKHYAITIMAPGVPVIFVVSDDAVKTDVVNALSQVKARGAECLVVGSQDLANSDAFLPVPDTGETSAIMNMVPLQLLAYYLGIELGHDIDKPRNIAKSVTVK